MKRYKVVNARSIDDCYDARLWFVDDTMTGKIVFKGSKYRCVSRCKDLNSK